MKNLEDLRKEARATWEKLMKENPDIHKEEGWRLFWVGYLESTYELQTFSANSLSK